MLHVFLKIFIFIHISQLNLTIQYSTTTRIKFSTPNLFYTLRNSKKKKEQILYNKQQ